MFTFVTSNSGKLKTARQYLEPFGILFRHGNLSISEIQSSSVVEISIAKAKQAFSIIKGPVLISDHSWEIRALNGFPGPFMKYMNQWLTAEDFLKLMAGQKDRNVIRREVLHYMDAEHSQYFISDLQGTVLQEARGHGLSAMRVIGLSPDGKSVAERFTEGLGLPEDHLIWEKFADWFKKR